MSEPATKPHTRYVVGGIYTCKRVDDTLFGVLMGGTHRKNGLKTGKIVSESHIPAQVIENSLGLDEWTLIAEPVPCEILRRLEAEVVVADERIFALECRLKDLEEAKPAPASGVDPILKLAGEKVDHAASISDVRARRRSQV